MSRQLTYDFDDLPLLTQPDPETGRIIQSALISGTVLLNYWMSGEWAISELYADGFIDVDKKLNARGFERRSQLLQRGWLIYDAIMDQLGEPKWQARMQDTVNNAIDEERAA